MANFIKQTYDSSYLFSQGGEIEKHHRNITEYIIGSTRIDDKNSEAFRGVLEDIKRYQKSSILYSIVLRNDVVLCISKNREMPRAFKVFSAKDLKNNDGNKVFIDVTGLISMNNGYYTCNKIDILVTYLFEAITWLLYDKTPLVLMNNSNITLSGIECFVSLCDYLIGYFRFFGYNENRDKILYLCGLYFLERIMGKDDDQYTKNLAAKVAGVNSSSIGAYSLYYEPAVDFKDINAFITMLANTFKLKGLTTEVFISKWIYLYGEGTQYAPELFTAYSNMIIGAYCGSYIVKQKKIESLCGKEMVRFATSVLKFGVDEFDKRGYMSESELDKTLVHDKATQLLADSILARNNKPDNIKFIKEDFASKDIVENKCKNTIEYYTNTFQKDKIGNHLYLAAKLGLNSLVNENSLGTVPTVISEGKKFFNNSDKVKLRLAINSSINKLSTLNEEKATSNSAALAELMQCKNML